MSLAALIAGLVVGVAVGAWNGHDLGASVAKYSANGTSGRAGLGLVRRTAMLAAALGGSLFLGPHAWAGVAAGYLAGFVFMVRRKVRAHVG